VRSLLSLAFLCGLFVAGCTPDAGLPDGGDGPADAGDPGDASDGGDEGSEPTCAVRNGGCDPNATCSEARGWIECSCRGGWRGAGWKCVDRDECLGDHGCHALARCVNLPGSYDCRCRDGYEGDGFVSCVDVDECVRVPNGGCHPDATCRNLPGRRECTCRAGFEGDGVTSCVDATWARVGTLPAAFAPEAVFANGRLYVAGGDFGGGETRNHSTWSAPVASDGTVGAFVSHGYLQSPVRDHCLLQMGERLLTVGGRMSADGVSSETGVGYLQQRELGRVGEADAMWFPGLSVLLHEVFRHGCFVQGERLFVVGGIGTWEQVPLAEVRWGDGVSNEFGFVLRPWEVGTALPRPRYDHAVVSTAGHAYVLGGTEVLSDGSHVATRGALFATVSDGVIGPWQETTALPAECPTRRPPLALHGGFVYALGPCAVRAPIGVDGRLGAWQQLSPQPEPGRLRERNALAVGNGFAFIVGGVGRDDVALWRLE
jgi:hypothetical protein